MTSELWNKTECRSLADETEYLEFWEYSSKEVNFSVNVRHFACRWGNMKQVAILKNYPKNSVSKLDYDKEPKMSEKAEILDELRVMRDFDNPVALEVFPKRSNIVDNLNMYHLWILEKSEIPFDINVKFPQMRFGWNRVCLDGKVILYKTKNIFTGGKVSSRIYYLKTETGDEFSWYNKQNFKDIIIGENDVAVEITSQNPNYVTTLIVIPKTIQLPFGLIKLNTRSKKNF